MVWPCGKERIAKRVYVGDALVVVQWVRPRKRLFKKKSLDVRQAMRMVQDRGEWRGFVRRSA